MDRSFLSNEEVVAASRQFVCIRLSTYESQEEADFLKSLYVGRSGDLENTTFALLSPDGSRTLARPGRGPRAFRNPSQLASRMNQMAENYPGSRDARFTDPQLPALDRVDLALNVAACEGLPMLVTYAADADALKSLHKSMAETVWTEELAGQFVMVATTKRTDLKPLNGLAEDSAIVVVDPGPFGITGRVKHQYQAVTSQLPDSLHQFVQSFKPAPKNYQEHRLLGLQLGLEWETVIPATDPMANQARARARARYAD